MPPKDLSDDGPDWLRGSGVRVDEFRRLAAEQRAIRSIHTAPKAMPVPENRSRNLKRAGQGLDFWTSSEPTAAAVSKASGSAKKKDGCENLVLRMETAGAASFSPGRHVFYVHGRPCMVPVDRNHESVTFAGSPSYRRPESKKPRA